MLQDGVVLAWELSFAIEDPHAADLFKETLMSWGVAVTHAYASLLSSVVVMM